MVLQEQSTLPIKNPKRMHENVRLFDQCIKASGAKTALYMTWARKHAPETQTAITTAYTSIGREVGALLIPAGVAWALFLKKHDRPTLHDDVRRSGTSNGLNLGMEHLSHDQIIQLFRGYPPAIALYDSLREFYGDALLIEEQTPDQNQSMSRIDLDGASGRLRRPAAAAGVRDLGRLTASQGGRHHWTSF